MEPTVDPTFAKSESSYNIINEKFKILTNQIDKKIFLKNKIKKYGKGTFKNLDITVILLVKHLHNVLNEKFNNKDLNFFWRENKDLN